MARAGKATVGLRRARADLLPVVRSELAELEKLEQRFLELKLQIFRDNVDKGVELGSILLLARPKVKGRYYEWLGEKLAIDPSTADNYIVIAELARDAPHVIQRYKEFGPSKLYKVARLEPGPRQLFLREPDLQSLTDREFAERIAPFMPRPKRAVSGNMRAHGLRMKAQAVAKQLRDAEPGPVEDGEMRAGLKRDLVELARAARALAARIR